MTDETTTSALTLPDTVPEGIPDVGATPTNTSPADPLAAIKADVPNQVDTLAVQIKQALVEGYMRGYNTAWRGAVGLTPKQFFSALGTKSVAFLIRGGQVRAFANGAYPDLALPGIPENYAIEPADDGSVTVNEI